MSNTVSDSALTALRGGRPWQPSAPPCCMRCKTPVAAVETSTKAIRTLFTAEAIYTTLTFACKKCGHSNFKVAIAEPEAA